MTFGALAVQLKDNVCICEVKEPGLFVGVGQAAGVYLQKFLEETIGFTDRQEAYALLGGHDEHLHVFQESFDCQFVSRGDELVVVDVEVPTHLTAEQRGLFEQLAQSLGSEVHTKEKSFFDRLKEVLGG